MFSVVFSLFSENKDSRIFLSVLGTQTSFSLSFFGVSVGFCLGPPLFPGSSLFYVGVGGILWSFLNQDRDGGKEKNEGSSYLGFRHRKWGWAVFPFFYRK